MYEYKTLMVQISPDPLLNREAAAGWECFAVAGGGFGEDGRLMSLGMTLFLRKPKKPPVPPDVAAQLRSKRR